MLYAVLTTRRHRAAEEATRIDSRHRRRWLIALRLASAPRLPSQTNAEQTLWQSRASRFSFRADSHLSPSCLPAGPICNTPPPVCTAASIASASRLVRCSRTHCRLAADDGAKQATTQRRTEQAAPSPTSQLEADSAHRTERFGDSQTALQI